MIFLLLQDDDTESAWMSRCVLILGCQVRISSSPPVQQQLFCHSQPYSIHVIMEELRNINMCLTIACAWLWHNLYKVICNHICKVVKKILIHTLKQKMTNFLNQEHFKIKCSILGKSLSLTLKHFPVIFSICSAVVLPNWQTFNCLEVFGSSIEWAKST